MAKGKGKGGNRNRQNRRNTRFYQRATGNVQLQDQSQVDLLNQMLQQATADFQRERQAGRSIYGGYQDELRDVPRPGFGQIGEDFQAGLSSVAPMFSGDEYMPGTEIGAGQDLGLAFGEAGQTMLANLAAREGMARSSAGREGALAGRYAQDALLQAFQDKMQGYQNQLGQVRADDPWQIQQEVGNLREQSLEQQLTRSKLESDAAFAKWLQDYLGGGASRGFGGAGPRGGQGMGTPGPSGIPSGTTSPRGEFRPGMTNFNPRGGRQRPRWGHGRVGPWKQQYNPYAMLPEGASGLRRPGDTYAPPTAPVMPGTYYYPPQPPPEEELPLPGTYYIP